VGHTGEVHGFRPDSYGDSFADIYDEWYQDVSDAEGTVAFLLDLANGRPVHELGIGTGRIALPLAAAGVAVSGIDASEPMVALLRAKEGGESVEVVIGDMAEVGTLAPPPGARFGVMFVAFNTFFNLTSREAQQRCLDGVASRLAPGGRFVLEAFVPADHTYDVDDWSGPVGVRSIEYDRVVLSVSRRDIGSQILTGQYVELSEAGGVRLRPWVIRYAAPAELDAMAATAGLELVSRHSGWRGEPFTASSPHHVSVYRSAGAPGE